MNLNEKFFQAGANEPEKVQDVLVENEKIVWNGKPQKKAFVLNNVLKMLPIAIIWIAFDSFFIAMIAMNFSDLPPVAIPFLCIFFVAHLTPVWVWIYNCATASKRHKNTEYAFTNQRIIVRKGLIAADFKNIWYKDVVAVNLRYGLVDKLVKVGDIYVTSVGKATVLEDLDNPATVEAILQDLISSQKADVSYTDNAKVTYVKCKYCGTKNIEGKSANCSSCGAPLD